MRIFCVANFDMSKVSDTSKVSETLSLTQEHRHRFSKFLKFGKSHSFKRFLFFLLLIQVFPIFVFNQNIENQLIRIDSLYKINQTQNALNLSEMLRTEYLKSDSINNYLKISLKKGNILLDENVPNAIEVFTETIRESSYNLQKTNLILADVYHRLGVAHYILSDYKNAIKKWEKALFIRKEIFGESNLKLWRSYFNIGAANEYLGNIKNGEAYFLKALNIAKKHSDISKIGNTLQKLGDIEGAAGDYESAIGYYSQAIEFLKKILPPNDWSFAELFSLIGHANYNLEKYKQALFNYEKSFNLYNSGNSETHITGQIQSLNNLSNTYFSSKNYKKAIQGYHKCAKLNLTLDNKFDLAKNYSNLGLAYLKISELKSAGFYFKEAIQIREELYGNVNPGNTLYYNNFGLFNLYHRDFKEGLKNYQKALFTLIPEFRDNDFFVNPNISETQIFGKKSDLRSTLNAKGRILRAWAKSKNNDLKLLKLSLETFQLAIQVIDLMREDHTAEGSKLFWTEETLHVFENAIQVAAELYELTGEKNYLKTAFDCSEKSKSIVLLEAMRDAQAKQFAGIPDSLISKEKDLKKQLTELEESLFYEKQKSKTDSAQIAGLEKQIFDKKLICNELIDDLEKSHPEYYSMKYDFSTADVAEVQSWLDENQAMLSYFVGDSSVYIFKILKSDLEVFSVDLDFDLDRLVSDLHGSLYSYFLEENRSNELFQKESGRYANTAYELWQKLILPAGDLPENLIIVPAGVLGYIPFEVLLKNAPESVDDFRNHDYLIKNHCVSYSYSATLLREMRQKKHEPKYRKLLAFAPEFKNQESQNSRVFSVRGSLNALKYNIPEAKAIQNIFGGKLLSGEDATMQNFIRLAGDYCLLHCATHGKADDQNAHYSYLAFTEKDSNEYLLYVRDLYNMELNADLVTLSACETGIGKLYRGEGIASLARGFSYAGAGSIVTTLWSVNDKKMSELMELFYQNLKAGMTKDKALQTAKLAYLNKTENYFCHPYFWAASIPIGDMSGVEVESGISLILLTCGVFIVVVILFLLYHKKNVLRIGKN